MLTPHLSRQWKKTDLWNKRWAHSVYRENMHGGTSSLHLVATVKKKKCLFARDERKRLNLMLQKLQVKKRHFHCTNRKFIRPAGEWFAAHVIQVSSFLTNKAKLPGWDRMSTFTLPYLYILCNGRQEWLKGLQNYSARQKFGNTFSFISCFFFYFLDYLHCRSSRKASKLLMTQAFYILDPSK